MGFTCLQSWSYAELLLAVASYLLFRHEGGILLIHLTARKKMKCISQNISNSAAYSSLPTRRNANAFPHVLTDSVHEFVFWHKIFLLFDKVSLLPCLVQLTQCRLHLFFFFWVSCLRDQPPTAYLKCQRLYRRKEKYNTMLQSSVQKRFAASIQMYPQKLSEPSLYRQGLIHNRGGLWYISVWHPGWWLGEILGRYMTVAQVIGLQGTFLSDQSWRRRARHVGNEKQQSLHFSHTMQCQPLLVT